MLTIGRPLIHLGRAPAVALVALALHAASGAAQRQENPAEQALHAALAAVSERNIRAHLRFLADDLLEGRAPGTRGGRIAESYIAARFAAAGLEPAGDDGTYFQHVALVGVKPSPSLVLGANRRTTTLEYLTDYVAWPETPDSTVTADGEVVFVGHGITAPEWGWDDYAGQRLAGRIALIMVNDPGLYDSTVFAGSAMTYYGRWTYKVEQAARMGAVGAILVHTNETATYPWNVVRSSWSGEQIALADRPRSSLAFGAWISEDAARGILAAAGRDLDLMRRRAQRRDFRPIPTGVTAALHIVSGVRRFEAANVVARLPGSDSAAGGEAVVFTAHHDHKGIGTPVGGDSIYNGAEDNASGVAVLLDIARAIATTNAPARSMIFVATTAEEAGLLGAEAYVRDPVVPLERTVAALNIDRANIRGTTADISALGAGRSTLGAPFVRAAAAEGLIARPDPEPERGNFFRSDHFPFARAGVPVLSIRSGMEFRDRPPEWGIEQEVVYNGDRYHQPADEYSDAFDLAGAAQQARVMIRAAWAVAQSPVFPAWNPDAEFHEVGRRLEALRTGR